MRRLIGVFVCVLGATAPADADVVTDWSAITISTIGAGAPVPGPGRLIEYAMVHIAMHDAVQAIQQRFETYSPGITPTTGSVIAAAAKAARDVLVNRFPEQTATLDAAYSTYLADHQIASNDGGIAAGAQAAAAIIQGRVNDGAYPVPAPAFFGGTEPGQWRPTVLTATGEPTPMAVAWMATTRPFTVMHASQFFAPTPPRLTSRDYTRDYNEVKELEGTWARAVRRSRPRLPCFIPAIRWCYGTRRSGRLPTGMPPTLAIAPGSSHLSIWRWLTHA